MEKLRYEKPMAEVILFESEDVITTSGMDDSIANPDNGIWEDVDDPYYYDYYE